MSICKAQPIHHVSGMSYLPINAMFYIFIDYNYPTTTNHLTIQYIVFYLKKSSLLTNLTPTGTSVDSQQRAEPDVKTPGENHNPHTRYRGSSIV